jgi:DNA-directed RNA polymerase specialized sigma24 family protein
MESMDSASDIRNFNNLFNEYYSRFVRFAMGYLKDRPVAEDFVSEAFTLYWENRENLLPNTNAPAYILTIVKNKCINHLHHEQIRLRCRKGNDRACRMGVEYADFYLGSVRSGRPLFGRNARNCS